MPSRRDVFYNSGIFHVFNKTVDRKLVFSEANCASYFLELLSYYRSSKVRLRYSLFRVLSSFLKVPIETEIRYAKYFKIEILAYCLMPNHFHILLKQKQDKGIIRFMSDILNSITRYYNVLHKRKGPLFLPQFRSQVILSREQLIHVSRYIHLNPYSSGLVNQLHELESYPLSSLREYLTDENICNCEIVLSQMQDTAEVYRKFVLDNADYQKTLEYCKHVDNFL